MPAVERRAVIGSRPARRELAADPLLQRGRRVEVGRQLGARGDGGAPALDAAGRLEPGDGGDEVAAGEVVGRRERGALGVVRLLLGDGGEAERAAGRDPAERPGAPADLALDDVAILHARELYGVAAGWLRCQAAMPLTMKSRSPGLT